MITLKDITIDDKALFDEYLSLRRHELSDISFTNLFIWREAYQVKYTILDGFLCIVGKYKNNPPFALVPLGQGNVAPIIEKMMTYFKEQCNKFTMTAISEEIKNEIEQVMPGKFTFKADRNLFDYVYLASDLITLKGKKFHSKRNHINKFKAQNKYLYYSLTSENIDECVAAALKWCEKRNCKESEGLEMEKFAILEALNNFDKLKYKGGFIKVNDRVVAFTLGEKIADDMAVIHIEKGDPDIQGSYAVINQAFCEHEWQDVSYINREEDMGIPGLRKAKESYRPVKMIKKYVAKKQ